MARLYAVILEFNGGTYISQVLSDSVDRAAIDWSNKFLQSKVLGSLSSDFVCSFLESHLEYGLIAIDGVIDVWTFVFELNGIEARGHVIGQ